MASSSYFYSIQGHPPYDDDIQSTSSSSSQEVENDVTLHSVHSSTASAADSGFADETNITQSNSGNRHVIRIRRQRQSKNYTGMTDPDSHWDHHHQPHNSFIRNKVSSVIPHAIYIPKLDNVAQYTYITISESDMGDRDAAPEGAVVSESYDDSDNYSYEINSNFNRKNSNDVCGVVVNDCHGCDLTLMEELSKSISVRSMTYDDTWGMTTAMLIE